MEKILPVERRLIEMLKSNMSNGQKNLWIEGKSGGGKTFSIKSLADDFEKSSILPVFLDGVSYDNIAYAPFFHGLGNSFYNNNFCENNFLIEGVELIPNAGTYIHKLSKIFKSRNAEKRALRDYGLNEKEQDILCKLEYLSEKRELIFICDHLNKWDEKSLHLLYYILQNIDDRYEFLSNCIFLLVFSTDIKSEETSYLNKLKHHKEMVLIECPKFRDEDFQEVLDILGGPKGMSLSEEKMLFSLSAGHIQLLIELIRELNLNHCTVEELNGSGQELLSEVLTNRLHQCDVSGEQIQTTLKYASLLGIAFSQYELAKIIELDDVTFQKIIEHSKKLHLVHSRKNYPDILRFVHNIIHSIFQRSIKGNEKDYCEKIATCMREICPGKYSRRVKYSRNLEEVLSLTILNLIKQLREDGRISPKDLDSCYHLLKDNPRYNHYYEYLLLMQNAYELYYTGQFEETLKILLQSDSYYPFELLAEREILCSCCYNKKIDSSFREEGIQRIEQFAELEKCNGERDVYERVLLRLMVLKIHIGEVNQAKEIEQRIIASLNQRYSYDDEAKDSYHTLNRISNASHSCDFAKTKMASAVKYFGFDKVKGCLWRDIKKYYMALVNYGGVLCLNAEYVKSFEVMEEALTLFQRFQNYTFPRPNIMKNNYLVAGYFSHNISIEECKEGFRTMIQDMHICAERLFFTSNYSIFTALSGDIISALDILEEEGRINPPTSDREALYDYRLVVNTSVYKYLLGEKDDALISLNLLKDSRGGLKKTNDGTFDKKRLEKLIDCMGKSAQPCDAMTWENILLENNSYQITPWNYYGKGFVFTTVFNWDIL